MAHVISAKSLLRRISTMIELLANLDPMTLSGALATGIAGLSAAVVHLYRSQFALQREVNEKVSKSLEDCLTDRKDLWQALIRIDPNAEQLRNIK
jgi:hypothetical protein